ncbi:MAG: DnaJ domain-containing protein [Chloroflexota bacterium]
MSGPTFRGDPYRVLDVRHDASAEEVKRHWRDLAREHHPDRAGGDGHERERLTTRMARINAAYDVLRDPVRRARYDASPHARRDRYADVGRDGQRYGGPPPPPPTRPVTARFDTSALFRERNATVQHDATPLHHTHEPPRRASLGKMQATEWREYRQSPDLRASLPNGPVYRSMDPARAQLPSLDDARATVLGFGRFHGLTLGDVAEQEPTYIDWIASTITRDRDLVMRARVVASDLDERGVERRPNIARV